MSSKESLNIIRGTQYQETGALLAFLHDDEEEARNQIHPLDADDIEALAKAAARLAELATRIRYERTL